MNDLQTLHDKLIRAAAAIAALVHDPNLSTITTTRKVAVKAKPAKAIKRRSANKGRTYAPGTHWTQRPGGKERLSSIMKRTFAKPTPTVDTTASQSL